MKQSRRGSHWVITKLCDVPDIVHGIAITNTGDIYYTLRNSKTLFKHNLNTGSGASIQLDDSSEDFGKYSGRDLVWHEKSNSLYICSGYSVVQYQISGEKISKVISSFSIPFRDGNLQEATVRWPWGITLDKDSNLIITDQYNIRKIDLAQETVETIGDCSCMRRKESTFNCPWSVAVVDDDTMYVSDRRNQCIRRITRNSSAIVAGTPGIKGGRDGKLRIARFKYPNGLLLQSDTSLLVADQVGIRRVDLKNDAVTTLVRGLKAHVLTQDKDGILYVGIEGGILKMESRWKYERYLWIGRLKEDSSYCFLTQLPFDVIREIASCIRYNIM